MVAEQAVLVGVDWGGAQHYVCAERPDGTPLFGEYVPHSGGGLAALRTRLHGWCGGDFSRVRAAIEVPHGPVADFFLDCGAQLFLMPPRRCAALRGALQNSGAKDDARDARTLVRALVRLPESLVEVRPRGPAQLELRAACTDRETLVADQHAYVERLRTRLRDYFPALLEEFAADLPRPAFAAVFAVVPTPAAAQACAPRTFAKAVRAARLRRDPEALLAALRAPALPLAATVVDCAVRDAQAALRRLAFLRTELAAAEDRVAAALAAWRTEDPAAQKQRERDELILRSLPGVGDVVLAALVAEAAELLRRRDDRALRVYAGVAAVTVQSGAVRRVRMRRAASHRLRVAVHHWAHAAMQNDPRTRAAYVAHRARGHTHGRALRGIADRLLALACVLLRKDELFDPVRRAGKEQNQPAG